MQATPVKPPTNGGSGNGQKKSKNAKKKAKKAATNANLKAENAKLKKENQKIRRQLKQMRVVTLLPQTPIEVVQPATQYCVGSIYGELRQSLRDERYAMLYDGPLDAAPVIANGPWNADAVAEFQRQTANADPGTGELAAPRHRVPTVWAAVNPRTRKLAIHLEAPFAFMEHIKRSHVLQEGFGCRVSGFEVLVENNGFADLYFQHDGGCANWGAAAGAPVADADWTTADLGACNMSVLAGTTAKLWFSPKYCSGRSPELRKKQRFDAYKAGLGTAEYAGFIGGDAAHNRNNATRNQAPGANFALWDPALGENIPPIHITVHIDHASVARNLAKAGLTVASAFGFPRPAHHSRSPSKNIKVCNIMFLSTEQHQERLT